LAQDLDDYSSDDSGHVYHSIYSSGNPLPPGPHSLRPSDFPSCYYTMHPYLFALVSYPCLSQKVLAHHLTDPCLVTLLYASLMSLLLPPVSVELLPHLWGYSKGLLFFALLNLVLLVLLTPFYVLDCATDNAVVDFLLTSFLIIVIARKIMVALTFPRAASSDELRVNDDTLDDTGALTYHTVATRLRAAATPGHLRSYYTANAATTTTTATNTGQAFLPDITTDPHTFPLLASYNLKHLSSLKAILAHLLNNQRSVQINDLLQVYRHQVGQTHANVLGECTTYIHNHTPATIQQAQRSALRRYFDTDASVSDVYSHPLPESFYTNNSILPQATAPVYLLRWFLLRHLANPSPTLASIAVLKKLLETLQSHAAATITSHSLAAHFTSLNPLSPILSDPLHDAKSIYEETSDNSFTTHSSNLNGDVTVFPTPLRFVLNLLYYCYSFTPFYSLHNLYQTFQAPPVHPSTRVVLDNTDKLILPFHHLRIGCFEVMGGRLQKEFFVVRENGRVLDGFIASFKPEGTVAEDVRRKEKVVMYNNPNAGIYELTLPTLGLPLSQSLFYEGRDVLCDRFVNRDNTNVTWYGKKGWVYVGWNYGGYGRSVVNGREYSGWADYGLRAVTDALKRIVGLSESVVCTLSIKGDGVSVTNYLKAKYPDLTKFCFHGESIGGMVATHCAASTPAIGGDGCDKILFVDRSFSHLPAVAQRMLHPVLGNIMNSVAPWWDSNVVKSYKSVGEDYRRLVAADCMGDQIIHHEASLISGVAVERVLGESFVGWKGAVDGSGNEMEVWEERVRRNSQVDDDEIVLLKKQTGLAGDGIAAVMRRFAGAVRAIGIRTTRMNRSLKEVAGERDGFSDSDSDDGGGGEEGGRDLEAASSPRIPPYFQDVNIIWSNLSLCDGLVGMALGSAAKSSRDGVYCWMSTAIAFGACTVLRRVRARVEATGADMDASDWSVTDDDFSGRFGGRCSTGAVSLPQCIKAVKLVAGRLEAEGDIPPSLLDDILITIAALEMIKTAVLNAATGADWKDRVEKETVVNLTGGHNTPWEDHERDLLAAFLAANPSDNGR
jgi:hypothetical protein